MAIFIVKTINDRNLVLEADHFVLSAHSEVYTFYGDSDGKNIVASLPSRDVFAVVGEEAEQADFYSRDEWGPNDEAADLLERATDLLAGEEVPTDADPEFWADYFDFVGEPPAESNAPEETHE